MQEKWKDLIPFYVAGTLPENQKKSLEAYIAQCGEPCMDEVEEWRMIASATWQTASDLGTDLPPLSQAIRAEVARDAELRASGKVISPNGFNNDMPNNVTNAPVAPPRHLEQPKQRRGSRIPLTMVAAFMTVVIFGGLLISQLNPGDLEPTPAFLTEVSDVELLITDEFGGEIGLLPNNDNTNSGIVSTPTPLAPQPSLTFSPTPLRPTATPFATNTLPPNSGGSITESSFAPAGTCIIRNDTQGALTVYRDASFEANPVGVMQQGQESSVRVQFGGWYELSYGRWVYGANVTAVSDCSSIITATPTAVGDNPDAGGINNNNGIPNCQVTNNSADPMSLYQWPDYNSPVNGRLAPGQSADVVIGNNGWYQIFYAQWIEGSNVTVTGDGCGNLWTPTPTIAASPTIINPTFVASDGAIAEVQTTSTIARSIPSTLGIHMGELLSGSPLRIIAHNGVSGPQRWYLVNLPGGGTGWIPALDVQVIPNDLDVPPAATVPFVPTLTPPGFVPTQATPQVQNWSHVATVVEQGCGGETGVQNTVAVQLQVFNGYVQMRYPTSGISFTLDSVSAERYIGSYQTSATIEVDMTFTSNTTYIATETVTAESGCIVRTSWAGTKS